jgi:PBP1b-binding outer membrane lipoprotein LpoB
MKILHKIMLVALVAVMLVSCAQPTAQVVVQTQVVEKEVTKEVV